MQSKKILILGHKGMLGQMVDAYFSEKGFSIIKIKSRFNSEERVDFLEEIKAHPDAIVMNCIGKIKQKTDDDNELLWANALLPLALSNDLPASQILIQPSTDCVFDGNTKEPYEENQHPNALDTYGWSKRLGEVALKNRPNTIVYRVSIIGPDLNQNGKGLLSWFLSNAPKAELNGFVNHYWNGITTLEWCKKIEEILKNENLENTFFEIGGTKESYTKFQMLQLFQKYFNTDYVISENETERVDRRLVPTVISKSLENQLEELVNFLPQFKAIHS